MGDHRGPDPLTPLVRLPIKPARRRRHNREPPVRKSAEPEMTKPERDGRKQQRKLRPSRPVRNPSLEQPPRQELFRQRQYPKRPQKPNRRSRQQNRGSPEVSQSQPGRQRRAHRKEIQKISQPDRPLPRRGQKTKTSPLHFAQHQHHGRGKPDEHQM